MLALTMRAMCVAGVGALVWVTAACGDGAQPASAVRDAGGLVDATVDAALDAGQSPYESMAALVRRSCMFTSCHGGSGAGEANLNFAKALASGGSLADVLNDVPSCEYDAMDRVEPFAPDKSWLMVKLEGAHRADGTLSFEPDATWLADKQSDGGLEAGSTCPRTELGELTFGRLMPISGTASRQLPDEEIAVFRRWIEAGAPAR